MSGKIWRKVGLVAMSSGMLFGGIGCIGLDNGFLRQFLIFLADTTIAGAVGLSGGLGGVIGGLGLGGA